MGSASDDLAEVLALVSLYADAMAPAGSTGRAARVEANREVLQSLIGELEELSGAREAALGEIDEQAARAQVAADLLTRLGAAAAGSDEVGVAGLLAELADAFPLDESATAASIGFLSLLTFADEAEEEGAG
jgi:hypothetical protein